MSLRAASCHGGVLCPRLAFLQAQCGRCALDVTFFLPLSSFMLHRLNIQLDPKRRKLPAKRSHVYLTIVILSLVDRGKKRNVHIYFSTRIHGSGITFSLVTMQGNVASSVSKDALQTFSWQEKRVREGEQVRGAGKRLVNIEIERNTKLLAAM